jgi:hypothetical protein
VRFDETRTGRQIERHVFDARAVRAVRQRATVGLKTLKQAFDLLAGPGSDLAPIYGM